MLENGVFNSTTHEETNNVHDMIPDSIKYTSLAALMMFVIGYAIGYGPSMYYFYFNTIYGWFSI